MDEHARMKYLRELLDICLEQFDEPDEKTQLRAELLINCYLSQAELHLDELKAVLVQIQRQATAESEQVNLLL